MTVAVLAMDGSPDRVAAARQASRPQRARAVSVHVAHVPPGLGRPGPPRAAQAGAPARA